MAKTIVIVDGPAGAGKSFFTDKAQEAGIAVVSSSLGKREFKAEEAALMSMTNDLGKVARALLLPDEVVIVERFISSQFVYGQLRDPSLRLAWQQNFRNIQVSCLAREVVEHARRELLWRQGYHIPGVVHLQWVFLVPPPSIIQRRRLEANKGYPWEPWTEVTTYLRLVDYLEQEGARVISMTKGTDAEITKTIDFLLALRRNEELALAAA